MEVVLARPRGFCAGVIRAIRIVEQALKVYGPPVYVLHEIVHNRHVLEELKQKGTYFAEDLEEIPPGSITIFSAHGVAKAVVETSRRQGLKVIDATCPLVNKVHRQARRYSAGGFEVIIIGDPGHAEVEGTRGRVEGLAHVLSTTDEVETLNVKNPERLAYVSQTTLSVDYTRKVIDALKARFPAITGPELSDICDATQSRQNAVRTISRDIDVLLVVGARNSSNSNRLRETGEQAGLPAYLIEDAGDIDPAWLKDKDRIGLTAGASAPETLVDGVLEKLREFGVCRITEAGD